MGITPANFPVWISPVSLRDREFQQAQALRAQGDYEKAAHQFDSLIARGDRQAQVEKDDMLGNGWFNIADAKKQWMWDQVPWLMAAGVSGFGVRYIGKSVLTAVAKSVGASTWMGRRLISPWTHLVAEKMFLALGMNAFFAGKDQYTSGQTSFQGASDFTLKTAGLGTQLLGATFGGGLLSGVLSMLWPTRYTVPLAMFAGEAIGFAATQIVLSQFNSKDNHYFVHGDQIDFGHWDDALFESAWIMGHLKVAHAGLNVVTKDGYDAGMAKQNKRLYSERGEMIAREGLTVESSSSKRSIPQRVLDGTVKNSKLGERAYAFSSLGYFGANLLGRHVPNAFVWKQMGDPRGGSIGIPQHTARLFNMFGVQFEFSHASRRNLKTAHKAMKDGRPVIVALPCHSSYIDIAALQYITALGHINMPVRFVSKAAAHLKVFNYSYDSVVIQRRGGEYQQVFDGAVRSHNEGIAYALYTSGTRAKQGGIGSQQAGAGKIVADGVNGQVPLILNVTTLGMNQIDFTRGGPRRPRKIMTEIEVIEPNKAIAEAAGKEWSYPLKPDAKKQVTEQITTTIRDRAFEAHRKGLDLLEKQAPEQYRDFMELNRGVIEMNPKVIVAKDQFGTHDGLYTTFREACRKIRTDPEYVEQVLVPRYLESV